MNIQRTVMFLVIAAGARPIRDIRRNPLDLIAGERVELMTSASGFVMTHSGSGKNGACVSNSYCDQLAYAARGWRLEGVFSR